MPVHCWNEAHGCEYTGTMDRMLERYENACTFHSVECLRCGEGVQHSDLPTHYVAGCIADVSTAITEHPSSEHTALTIEDVSAALEDLKAMFGDANHDQLHPLIQSQLNELTEQVRNQEAMFAEVTRELEASENILKDEMAQIAAVITSTVPHQPNREAQASKSSLSLRSEKAMILRKLEHFTHQSHDVLECLGQTFPQRDSNRIIAYCKTWDYRIRHFTSALPTTAARVKAIGSVIYVLTLENYDEMIQWKGAMRKFAEITVWHMRDACFTLAVKKDLSSSMCVDIEFNGMLVNSRCLPPFWRMRVRDTVKDDSLLSSRSVDCSCKFDKDTSAHFHVRFHIDIGSMNIGPPIRDGKMQFWIELNYE